MSILKKMFSDSKPVDPAQKILKAYEHLPLGLFSDSVSDVERWTVELLYLVRDAVKDNISEEMRYFTEDDWMASNAQTYTMKESAIAMNSFISNLEEGDAKVPPYLLEPLLTIAKSDVVGEAMTEQRFADVSKSLRKGAEAWVAERRRTRKG